MGHNHVEQYSVGSLVGSAGENFERLRAVAERLDLVALESQTASAIAHTRSSSTSRIRDRRDAAAGLMQSTLGSAPVLARISPDAADRLTASAQARHRQHGKTQANHRHQETETIMNGKITKGLAAGGLVTVLGIGGASLAARKRTRRPRREPSRPTGDRRRAGVDRRR